MFLTFLLLQIPIAFPFLEEREILDATTDFLRTSLFKLKPFIYIIALPAEAAFPPRQWHFNTTSTTIAATFKVLLLLGRVIIKTMLPFLQFNLLLLVIFLEAS